MNVPTWLSYSLITLLVSTPFYFIIQRDGGAKNENFDQHFRRLMWVPGLVAFGFRTYTDQGFSDVNFGAGESLWLYPVAFLIPLLIEIILIITVIQFNLARLSPEIITFREGNAHISKSVRLVLGNDTQPSVFLFGNLTATVAVGTVFTVIFSLVEEFGWRGFLQNQVIDSLGLVGGLIMGGLVWGAWHSPLVLMGYKFPDYQNLGAFVFMPISTIAIGIVTGWLFWLSGSIWVPALFNASTRVTSLLSSAALGEAGDSRRVRIAWLWLWTTVAGLCLVFWRASIP